MVRVGRRVLIQPPVDVPPPTITTREVNRLLLKNILDFTRVQYHNYKVNSDIVVCRDPLGSNPENLSPINRIL
jgi:hypothetical protein